MLLQQVCPGKTSASYQSIHLASYEDQRYILYGATDTAVICDASFRPIQILFLQQDSHEEENQMVSALAMSEFDGKQSQPDAMFSSTSLNQEKPARRLIDRQKDSEHVNILFTMAKDGVCRIWSPLLLSQPRTMSICAIIDPNQWLVSQHQSTSQYPIHALDGMEFIMAVEYAASHAFDRESDIHRIRLRKLQELAHDTSDLFFQIQADGSMIIWGVQNLAKAPQRLPRVLLVLRISQALNSADTVYFTKNITCYHDTSLARSRGSPAEVVMVGQSSAGRVSCFSVNMLELFDTGNAVAGLTLRQSWTGQQSRIRAIVKDHRQLCFTSVGELGDVSLWKLKTPRHGHRVAAGLVEVGSLPVGARNVKLVTPAWEGGSFMVYDGERVTLYTAGENANCNVVLDLPDYDPQYPLTLLDSFEIPYLVEVEGRSGKTTDVAWRRYILGFSTKDNTVFTWRRNDDNSLPTLFSKENLPPQATDRAVTVESFAGTLPRSLHSTHLNVFATYSKSESNISYWECGRDFHTHPGRDSVWQRAERITTRDNLILFQCGANGKLALVYENPNGKYELEIWGSVGGRASERLEGRFEGLDRIYDLDWMVTADARHNLAVAFQNSISMFSPIRTDSVTSPPRWESFMQVFVPSFIKHPISTIAWLDMGTLSVGAGGTMLLYSKWLSEENMTISQGYEYIQKLPTLHHALATLHGPLPDYHPNLLMEFFLWGKMRVVRKILFNLYHYIQYIEQSNDTSTSPLPIPLEEILKTDEDAQMERPNVSDLFVKDDDSKTTNEFKFLTDATCKEMIEFLTRVPLAELSKTAQFDLTAFIEAFTQFDRQKGVIDENGVRFMMFVRRFNHLNYLLPPSQRPLMLSYRDIAWAYHSESQDLLLEFCVNSLKGPMMWSDARTLGLFLWLRKKETIVKQLELIARNQYMGKDGVKDPVACTLLYIALRKRKLLHGLWRTSHGHVEQGKMTQFLANDFEVDRWKTAALKNAFALLGKQRFEYAAAFFLLGDKLQDAVNVCIKQLNDVQLAIAICRVYEPGEMGPVLTNLLNDQIKTASDPWLRNILLTMLGRSSQSIKETLIPSEAEKKVTGHTTMHRDPTLLLLYRYLLNKIPGSLKLEGDEEYSAVVRAAEAYEHFGCPLLSLVILKHWGYVLPTDVPSLDGEQNGYETRTVTGASASTSAPVADNTTKDQQYKTPPRSILEQETPQDSQANGHMEQASSTTSFSMGGFMGGFRSSSAMSAPSALDDGTLDFDSFGFGLSTPKSKPKNETTSSTTGTTGTTKPSKPKNMLDIFAGFGPPMDDGLETASNASADSFKKNNEGSGGETFDDKARGTEELLNDYITTLVVQLLTPMASALRTVSLKPELLKTPEFKNYVENIKYGWDKLSEHANVSSVVMEQALINKCIEIDTLPVCFHWLATTMSTGSPISLIVGHYSESCYSMVGIVLTAKLTPCMKAHIKEYARSILESSNEWYGLARTVSSMQQALPRWEQMVLASYIMLAAMALQEQDYATLSGMLFQWRRFSGFVMGDRGGAVKVIGEVLSGNLHSPLDRRMLTFDNYDGDNCDSTKTRQRLQRVILDAATTNALVMGLEGLLRDHGHRMSDETRRFVASSFLDQLIRSGIQLERQAIQIIETEFSNQPSSNGNGASSLGSNGATSPSQEHLRGYLEPWQRKYWIVLNGLESGGHLLPLVGSFMEARRTVHEHAPPAVTEDTSILYKTRSVITSFSFHPIEKSTVALCSRTDIIEVDLSRSMDFQKGLPGLEGELSDMESDMDMDEEDELGFEEELANMAASTAELSSTQPSIVTTSTSEGVGPLEGSNGLGGGSKSHNNLQSVLKNIFGTVKHQSSSDVPGSGSSGIPRRLSLASLNQQSGGDGGTKSGRGRNLSATATAERRKSIVVDNVLIRADIVATCSESHPNFPLYLTGHNPALDYPSATLWQFGQPRELNTYNGATGKVTKIHFDSFGQKFGATDVKGYMHLWRFDSNTLGSKPFLTLPSHNKIARDFSFLGSSSLLATTGHSADNKNVCLWDTLLPESKACTQSYKVHDGGGGYSIAFSKRHHLVVSGGRNGEIAIFDVRQTRLLHTLHAHEMHVRSLYMDDEGGYFCSGSGEGDMKVWSLDTFEQLSSFENLQARNRFQLQTFDRIPVKAYGVAQIAASMDSFYTCGPSGFLRARKKHSIPEFVV
ncbi:regulator of (H+)-ATPase in vacuolar membrane [Actinomortierella wolfii]|nr:regulator of (H+)-ATPase in vacuolar membrane [Actinomortierella wolfii]